MEAAKMNAEPSRQRKFPAQPLKSIKLQNILSFGPEGMELELKPLNVLIGANASGKSNLLEVLSLFKSMPTDPYGLVKDSGGVKEWAWKGPPRSPHTGESPEVALLLEYPQSGVQLRYSFSPRFLGSPPLFLLERLDSVQGGKTAVAHFEATGSHHATVKGEPTHDLDTDYSILSQLKDPTQYPEITYVGRLLPEFRLFRDWDFGPHSKIRVPQSLEPRRDFLSEDASNLALVLDDLERRGLGAEVARQLRCAYEEVEDVSTKSLGGFVFLSVRERGLNSPIPAERLSDGTLRYLSLIAILCHPDPPPLVCIEEPELGLHPDAIPAVAEMLKDASTRTQLIVTTHSPDLIDELSDTAESVVVCERTEKGTQMERLDPKPLKEWIDNYRLGGAWKTGVIGGRR